MRKFSIQDCAKILLFVVLFFATIGTGFGQQNTISRTETATITMPNIFGNNMVLQQNTQVPIWGWGKSGDKIEIIASWGKTKKTTVGIDGKWKAKIETPKANAGQAPIYTLSVKGQVNSISFDNILIGEVWVCAGQSNMEISLKALEKRFDSVDYINDLKAANYPNIRLFNVKKDSAQIPQVNCSGSWTSCSTATVANFSAVAYYFGRQLYTNKNVNVPIGLIQDAFSGSAIQCWLKRDVLEADSVLKKKYVDPVVSSTTKKPYLFYNAMIAPIIPFAIKGVIWYQGESNVGDNEIYTKANLAMIKDWRKDWGTDFSFYAVQMTPRFYKDKQANDTKFGRGIFRDCQSAIMTIPKTGIIVTSDLMQNADERSDSHPRNKKDVGIRLALWALAKDYEQKVQYLGPVYKSHQIIGDKIIISYKKESLVGGLTTKDSSYLRCFKIAGEDAKFYPAKAIIEGQTVVVSSPNVSKPVAVRYAYTDGAMTNLQNMEGLAAYPFRTDNINSAVAVDVSEEEVK